MYKWYPRLCGFKHSIYMLAHLFLSASIYHTSTAFVGKTAVCTLFGAYWWTRRNNLTVYNEWKKSTTKYRIRWPFVIAPFQHWKTRPESWIFIRHITFKIQQMQEECGWDTIWEALCGDLCGMASNEEPGCLMSTYKRYNVVQTRHFIQPVKWVTEGQKERLLWRKCHYVTELH